MKDLIIEVLGRYSGGVDAFGNNIIDFEWIAGAILFILGFYATLRIIGSIIKR